MFQVQPRHDAGATRVREEDRAVPKHAARRHVHHDLRAPRLVGGLHFHNHTLAGVELVDNHAHVVIIDLDRHLLDRLVLLAVHVPEHNLGGRHAELEALAAHVLHQDPQLQLSPPEHLEGLTPCLFALLHIDGDVVLHLLVETIPDHLRGQLRPVPPLERGVVGREGHAHGRGVDLDRLDRHCHIRVADSIRNSRFREARNLNNVPRLSDIQRHSAHAAVAAEDLGDFSHVDLHPLVVERDDGVVDLSAARVDATGQEAPEELVTAQHRRHHRKRFGGVSRRRGQVGDDEVEQRRRVLPRPVERQIRPPQAAGRVDDGEVELLLGGAEVREQVEHVRLHLVDARGLLVDLVDHDNRTHAAR
mmetsp:Transcript_13298/g.32302  ORF Transcript_13298/g.32302 Transcript_13298/m.32302 type:complete len:361 (+) Transcript_13298:660-1742(+)